MTLILKYGDVVYRVNGHDFILCHVIYIYVCVAYCGPDFVIIGLCVALCGESIEAGGIWSLATGLPNVVHRYHK
jgi:hypothetical protein